MSDKAKKPKGFKAFDALTRKVAAVPKAEADAKERQRKRRKK